VDTHLDRSGSSLYPTHTVRHAAPDLATIHPGIVTARLTKDRVSVRWPGEKYDEPLRSDALVRER
jgi:hypothetical protein